MLRRVALLLILLIVSGAAIWAAGHLGVSFPWNIAATGPEPPSKDRDPAPASATGQTTDKTPEATVGETAAALGGAPGEPTPGSGDVAIDISRISPEGTSVFAGRAEPDSYVTVLEDGKPAGTVKADSHGEWSLSTEHKFASIDPKLSYEVSRTPPPASAPAPEPPKTDVAKAEPAGPSAAAVAGEVMRKFESLVEEAREEAKKKDQAKAPEPPTEAPQVSAPAPQESTAAPSSAPAPSDTPAKSESTDVAAAAPPPQADPGTASAPSTSATTDTRAGDTSANDTGATVKSPQAQSTESKSAAAPAEPEARATATAEVVPPVPAPSTSAGTQTNVIPVPIMFVYNEATLTPEGERAAALLLEYLTLKRLSAVELTGHADERGTLEYNYDLSRERLETVSQILKQGGYTGELKLTPKGKTEPYMGVDRTAYTGEALYQLDRRVELRVTR